MRGLKSVAFRGQIRLRSKPECLMFTCFVAPRCILKWLSIRASVESTVPSTVMLVLALALPVSGVYSGVFVF